MSDSRLKLYTWLDVEGKIKTLKRSKAWPEEIDDIQVYADGVEVFLSLGAKEERARELLKEWFREWYNEKEDNLYLESISGDGRYLPVAFETEVLPLGKGEYVPPPLFGELVLFSDQGPGMDLPPPFPQDSPAVIAFYSFKGGVGRTLHLLAVLKAILEKQNHRRPSVLVVDADLEAPGLTWWVEEKGPSADISFLDLLSLAHYDDSDELPESLQLIVRSLEASLEEINGYPFYFLPAFRTMEQLMRFPVRPEHLTRSPGRNWFVGELFCRLGKALKVDYVLLDLRSGLSELTAPLLFDPRLFRFLFTTCASSSLKGIKLVLRQMAKVAPDCREKNDSKVHDPLLIFSMVPEEMKKSDIFTAIYQELLGLYPDHHKDDAEPGRLLTETTYFAQQLLYLESLGQAWDKLSGTSVLDGMKKLLSLLPLEEKTTPARLPPGSINEKLQKLINVCDDLEYAEQGKGESFLPVEGMVNLGRRFSSKMPVAVVMGAKGSGKTYLYLQMVRLGTWKGFLKDLNQGTLPVPMPEGNDILFYPLLWTGNAGDVFKALVQKSLEAVRQGIKVDNNCYHGHLREDIFSALENNQAWGRLEWRDHWIHLMGRALGIKNQGGHKRISVEGIQGFLKNRNVKIIFLIDGMEELFNRIKDNHAQQEALRGLLDVIDLMEDYRDRGFGVICFLRRDIAKAAIIENFGQYEARFKQFQLKWKFIEALRLVLWIAVTAGVLTPARGKKNEELLLLEPPEIAGELVPFWGRKLGAENSKEAITANWVLAALSDFQGQLQARDLVRFVKNAALMSKGNINYTERILQPAGMRKAVAPCSQKKIEDLAQEYGEAINRVFQRLMGLPPDVKKIPISTENITLQPSDIQWMESLGILLKRNDQYYMPEIFRHGLGYTLEKGARPMVLALKRKSLEGM